MAQEMECWLAVPHQEQALAARVVPRNAKTIIASFDGLAVQRRLVANVLSRHAAMFNERPGLTTYERFGRDKFVAPLLQTTKRT